MKVDTVMYHQATHQFIFRMDAEVINTKINLIIKSVKVGIAKAGIITAAEGIEVDTTMRMIIPMAGAAIRTQDAEIAA